ncbi:MULTISPECIES: hypothetical protein [Desertifilum]|uniref:hypothetical protein n=1 Tax=Desertifilum TaxID=1185872 RepID=UPI000A3F13AF|nr:MULTISPECIES: hypothetical protein [Desertifilum]MDA0212832.1 hypothetical protein [Cyanobacteria bacterium FC1]
MSANPQKPPKSLEELEAELYAPAGTMTASTATQPVKFKRPVRFLRRLFWVSLLLAIPTSLIWVANLPYPVVRQTMTEKAPILLLPSYIKIESHYKSAIAALEQADRLIENPTSAADIDLGGQKLQEAQKHLDALPIWLASSRYEYRYWGYGWQFSYAGWNSARARAGRLEAKVFQERNAQTQLSEANAALNQAKQQYAQAATPIDKPIAIAAWRSALDQYPQIPTSTLAGRTARQTYEASLRDFRETVGLAADNQRVATIIAGAREFGRQAAILGQNPPHPAEKWQQIAQLWEDAIRPLNQIRPDDPLGYAEAQKLMAEYKVNLAQIELRRSAEVNSVRAFERAQSEINALLARPNSTNPNYTISQLQSIINQLEKVQNGTTPYLEAQRLLLSAKAKLNEFQR